MTLVEATDWAYAAGIIDGEGSVSVSRKLNRKGQANYSVTVIVSMTDSDVPLWLLATFGGYYRVNPRKRRPTWKPLHMWWVSGPDAAVFLKGIIPFLKLKAFRAGVAEKLAVRSAGYRKNAKGSRGFDPLSDEERAEREALALQIRAENYRTNPAVRATSKWGVQ